MIFNFRAGLQVALTALPAGLAYAVAHYALDLDSARWWAAFVGAACLVPIDVFGRLSAMGDSDEEGEDPPGMMAFVRPSSGGHLMFLPMWLVGGLAAGLLMAGVVNP